MSEFDELMQIATAATQEATPVAEKPPASAPAEPAKALEQQTGAEGAGKGDGQPVVEAKPEPKPAEQPPADAKKPDWKAAAAAEREKQRARSASKDQAAQLQRQMGEMQQKLARYEEIERLKEQDPLAAAEKFGLSYDSLTKKYIEQIDKNPNQPPPVPGEVKALIQNFQALEGQVKHLQQQLATAERDKIVSGFDADAKAILQTKADEFELTRTAEEGPTLVRAIVAAHWKKTAEFDAAGRLVRDGETMPTEEACKLAEEFFEQKQLKRFAGTKKFKALASPEPPKPNPTPQPAKGTTTTLSQSLLQSGGGAPSFSGEFEELAAMAKRLEAQQGN